MAHMVRERTLTVRYSAQQMTYWMIYAGPVSFAATYLLAKGFDAGQVGVILACANLCSCALQPVLASFVDRAARPVLSQLLVGLAAVSFCSFAAIQLLPLPALAFAGLYFLGVLSFDVMVPLLNSLSVYYNQRGLFINYGMGRGAGSLAFAFASLGIGNAIRLGGVDWMPRIVLAFWVVFVAITLGYPAAGPVQGAEESRQEQGGCSLSAFFLRYKWYNLSLLGVLFLAIFHVMTENYMIELVRRLGGDSGTVGAALALATITATPVMMCFDRIHGKLSSKTILKTAGVMYVLKALLFQNAGSLAWVYGAELLQGVTYAFLSPVQMYYARERVAPGDMVKGQSMITAAYALGSALGNLTGGVLVGRFGVMAMLSAGVGIAVLGTLILFLTLGKRDE